MTPPRRRRSAAVLGRHEGEGPTREGGRLGRRRRYRAVLARVGGGPGRRQVDPAVAARAARSERNRVLVYLCAQDGIFPTSHS